ncbi:MAG: aspartate carbamoyltransferase regulatory subunit [Planctomycetes bacterium]|nr:aspartate carbamoyltransferase regulatory subunit [Planctomycetota bacterium]
MNDPAHAAESRPESPDRGREPLIKVTALREGTVIDHLVAGTALKVLDILGITFEGAVMIGLNLDSRKVGRKDIIKIERREVTPHEVAKIALLSPRASFSIIRDFQVVEKFTPSLPRLVEDMIRCPNPSCISRQDRVRTKFVVVRSDPLRVRCYYCERSQRKEEIELL